MYRWAKIGSMAPVVVECEFAGCKAKEAETAAVPLGLMQLHQANIYSIVQKQNPPKMDRPRIVCGWVDESGL